MGTLPHLRRENQDENQTGHGSKNLIVFCPKCKRETVMDIKDMEAKSMNMGAMFAMQTAVQTSTRIACEQMRKRQKECEEEEKKKKEEKTK